MIKREPLAISDQKLLELLDRPLPIYVKITYDQKWDDHGNVIPGPLRYYESDTGEDDDWHQIGETTYV